MDVRDAVSAARGAIEQAYRDEVIDGVGLEEFAFDDVSQEWKITIGFRRPERPLTETAERGAFRYFLPDMAYKLVRIRDSDGKVMGVTDRLLSPAE